MMKSIIAGASTLAFAAPAQATNCYGQISHVYTDRDGSFLIRSSFRGDWLQICSLNATWKGISQEVCKTWISTVLTGMSTSRTFNLYYAEDRACDAIPSYGNAPSPGYVMMMPS